MKRSEVNIDKVTPMMKQYLTIKEKYQDVILFFRLGDFYEMFFDDALTVSHELELVLTGKNAGLSEKIPMCGIPHHASTTYVEKLINKGYKVAICEQVEDVNASKGIVKRDVVQIVSAGALINSNYLNENENNYIGNLVNFGEFSGICYTDISTGEVEVLLLENDINNMISEIISLNIKELVHDGKADLKLLNILKNQFSVSISKYIEEYRSRQYNHLFKDINDERYIETCKHLLTYLEETQKRNLTHFTKINIKKNDSILKMDIYAKRNLELVETLRAKERNFSLLWFLDKTKTAMGSRKLKKWIMNPTTNKKELNHRYDIVEKLSTEFILKEELRNDLFEIYDLERLSGRVAYGNANGKDLLQLKHSLKTIPSINSILKQINYKESIPNLKKLYLLLDEAIYEDPPLGIKEGYLIKEGYNKELDELKALRKGGKDFIARFEYEEKQRTGIKNLKVGYNRIFGYYIEVSRGNVNLIPEDSNYERKQTLANCERYITPLLKEQESLILNAEEKIIKLEYELFINIRDNVKAYIVKLQEAAKIVSDIDVLQSLSVVSEENNLIRPELVDDSKLEIINSRHPVVEKVLDGEFVPNDIIMDKNTSILLITGPNMAGKSTYMRQIAIIVIMAQIGSFVPADKAILPVFDKIFTRIGATDDLVSGESTFMVEMIEANYALANATEHSLILFDELGRGTSTYDGMSIAEAIIEYVHNHIKCKTFFSTHYHELTYLERKLNNLKNIHVAAEEENGEITFLHKIEKGPTDKSYGIHVANLAQMPKELINRAEEILNNHETTNKKKTIMQPKLIVEKKSKTSIIEQRLNEIDPLEMTPMEAINFIYELKNKKGS